MARPVNTLDCFTAVAEPHRRAILDYLAAGERSVGEIATALDIRQPSASKHLRVLSEAGLVSARRVGRTILYRTDGSALRPLHEWTGRFERLWRHQLVRVKGRAEEGK